MVMDGKVVRTLIVLSLIGLIDAISYMAVAPSLIFYVQELGGTKEQYGLIMSAFSFCSFCLKPGTFRSVRSVRSIPAISFVVVSFEFVVVFSVFVVVQYLHLEFLNLQLLILMLLPILLLLLLFYSILNHIYLYPC